MGRFKIWMLVAGVAVGYVGWKSWRLSCVVKQDPQTITCADLGKNGCGKNAHIVLTDFYVATAEFVYEEKRSGKEWSKVWLPVVPMDGEYVKRLAALPEDAEEFPPAENFHVILQSENVSGQFELGQFAGLDSLPGVVINEVDSLDSDTKKLLKESYPRVDLDACWILDHRRKVPSTARGLMFMVLGAALIGGAILLFVRGAKKS